MSIGKSGRQHAPIGLVGNLHLHHAELVAAERGVPRSVVPQRTLRAIGRRKSAELDRDIAGACVNRFDRPRFGAGRLHAIGFCAGDLDVADDRCRCDRLPSDGLTHRRHPNWCG